ncbi:hypothetical protein, variant [Magnaporthiopsis poae ATCC 64411]|nr:hypothetical protein, variant [Magnaporthiopsis poae ATCC 64411]
MDCSAAAAGGGAGEVCALAASTFPAIRVFRGGGGHGPPAAYQGSMTAAAISQYLARHRRPAVSELATAETLASFQTIDHVVFVAFVPSQGGVIVDDTAAAADEDDLRTLSYRRAALRYRDEFSFGLVTNPALAGVQEGEGESGGGSRRAFVVCHRPGDGHVSRFVFPDLDDGGAALDAFIRDASRPDIAQLTPLNHQRYLDRGWPMVYLFACTEPEREALRTSLAKLAKSHRDSLTVVVADPFEFPGLPERLGLGSPLPSPQGCHLSGALHQLSNDRVYPYPRGRPIDARSVQQWGLDVFQGRVRPWLPPGASTTTSFTDAGPTRVASRKLSIASIPGVKIKIAGYGHDEL